jgi:hypothetical protein
MCCFIDICVSLMIVYQKIKICKQTRRLTQSQQIRKLIREAIINQNDVLSFPCTAATVQQRELCISLSSPTAHWAGHLWISDIETPLDARHEMFAARKLSSLRHPSRSRRTTSRLIHRPVMPKGECLHNGQRIYN